jgi:AcrR family transcriptional regulator
MPTEKKAPKPASAGSRTRLTQSERREATRRRILEATLECLAKYGYAQTGVAQIVAHARVSRGAWAHHFPSMNALMLEAAEFLMARVYERLGALLLELASSGEDRVEAVVGRIWDEFFASPVNEIYLELLVASRRDPKLAATLSSLLAAMEHNLRAASDQFFEPLPGAVDSPAHMMILTRWVMRGIALDAHMLPADALATARESWSRLLATQIAGRRGRTSQAP